MSGRVVCEYCTQKICADKRKDIENSLRYRTRKRVSCRMQSMTEPPNHQHRMIATIVIGTTCRARDSIVASQGHGDGRSIRLINGPTIPGPTTPRARSSMAPARWGRGGRPPDEIATRCNGAMWPHDNDDDGGGVEMMEHDDSVAGGGGNLLLSLIPWCCLRAFHDQRGGALWGRVRREGRRGPQDCRGGRGGPQPAHAQWRWGNRHQWRRGGRRMQAWVSRGGTEGWTDEGRGWQKERHGVLREGRSRWRRPNCCGGVVVCARAVGAACGGVWVVWAAPLAPVQTTGAGGCGRNGGITKATINDDVGG